MVTATYIKQGRKKEDTEPTSRLMDLTNARVGHNQISNTGRRNNWDLYHYNRLEDLEAHFSGLLSKLYEQEQDGAPEEQRDNFHTKGARLV